jgi:hypothetical protein
VKTKLANLQRTQQQYESRASENESIRLQNQNLQSDITRLRKETESQDTRISAMLAALGEHNRDREITYQAGSTQHHRLRDDFLELRDQDFYQVSTAIFKQLCEINPKLKNSPRTKAKIKALLAKAIFIDENQEATVKRIIQTINKELQLNDDYRLESTKVSKDVEDLVRKSLQFSIQLAKADPPGMIEIVPQGQIYNSTEHEVTSDCEEAGVVDLTVFPIYKAGERIMVKAEVRTHI